MEGARVQAKTLNLMIATTTEGFDFGGAASKRRSRFEGYTIGRRSRQWEKRRWRQILRKILYRTWRVPTEWKWIVAFLVGQMGEWNREKCVRVLMNDEFVLFMSLLTHTRFPGSWLTIFPAFEICQNRRNEVSQLSCAKFPNSFVKYFWTFNIFLNKIL